MFQIKTNMADVAKELKLAFSADRMAKICSTALTRTAKVGKLEIQKQMPKMLDRPTPFTVNSVMFKSATAQSLEAAVLIREEAFKGTAPVKYMAPETYGGERRQKRFERQLQAVGLLPAGMFAVPCRGAKLDAYGNWDRGQIVQVLSYLRAFGQQGYRANMNDKRQHRFTQKHGSMYFVGEAGKGGHLGIWEVKRFATKSVIKPIALFVKAPRYSKRVDFHGVAQRTAEKELPYQIKIAMDQAMARMKA